MNLLRDKTNLSEELRTWQRHGWLRALDYRVAKMLVLQQCADPIALIGALTSHQVGRGHTCLSLTQLANMQLGEQNQFDLPPAMWRPDPILPQAIQLVPLLQQVFATEQLQDLPARWQAYAESSDAVAMFSDTNGAGKGMEPLVYDPLRQLVYLRRYWQHESRIDSWLRSRMVRSVSNLPAPAILKNIIKSITGTADAANNTDLAELNWQEMACATAAKFSVSVITGGPGTGKTFTVIRVLSTLLELAKIQYWEDKDTNVRIALAAPTGKAAARLQESIQSELDKNPNDFAALRTCMPKKASTLHRLLGSQRDSRYFRHNQSFPLPFDVVVVDEASMIDTEMFDQLLDALADKTRLILLGDKDQLAPVETGSILASLCRGAEAGGYSEDHWQWLQDVTGETLPQQLIAKDNNQPQLNHVVMLRKSYRFSGLIADLAKAVNKSEQAQARELLSAAEQDKNSPVTVLNIASEGSLATAEVTKRLYFGFEHFAAACADDARNRAGSADAWAIQVLKAYSHFQCLTALREGPFGQRELNRHFSLLFSGKPDQWYHGRPVMVTNNDYSLNLNNGDIGVTLFHPESQLLKVAFMGNKKDTVRWVLPSRLSQVETVYAMTVHKSQGSEFQHAVLVLPDRSSPVLTKELVYTGITRAKQQLTLIIPSEKVWHDAITRRIERLGGLFN